VQRALPVAAQVLRVREAVGAVRVEGSTVSAAQRACCSFFSAMALVLGFSGREPVVVAKMFFLGIPVSARAGACNECTSHSSVKLFCPVTGAGWMITPCRRMIVVV
jgi:hypothetical protein